MKRLTLVMTLLQLSVLSYAQYALEISKVQGEYNGVEFSSDMQIKESIFEDVPKWILISEESGHKIYTRYEFARSGKRLKLITRNKIVTSNGDEILGKLKKDVQLIRSGIAGSFNLRRSESLLIDRRSISSIFISYEYHLEY